MGSNHGLSPFVVPLVRFILSMLAAAMFSVAGFAHAACSIYAGATSGPLTASKASINEYNYSSGYIELKIIDPTIIAETGNLNGWKMSVVKKSGGSGSTRTNYTVIDYINSCGAGSQYIKIPTGMLGNDSVVVLWSDSSMTQEVDYFRIGQQSYPAFQPSTCFASSEFPSSDTITWHQAGLTGSSARKDIARGPDGTGKWIETPYNGNDQGTPCASNDGTLALTKSVTSASTVYVGEQVSFRISVSLDGRADTQTNVKVSELLPSGLVYVSHAASKGSYSSSTNIWDIGSMTSGESVTLDLSAQAALVGVLTNSALVESTDFPSGTITPASASVTVLQPLTLTKTVSPGTVPFNTSATFTVSVKNNGPVALPSGFTVNDALPAGLTTGAPSTSAGSYAGGVWSILAGMPTGATYTLTLPVTSQTTEGSFTNTATAVAPFGGPNLTASATLVVGSSVSNFNVFETTTPTGAVNGRIFTKLVGAAFDLDVVAISAGVQAASFSGNVKLELLANTGTPGGGYGADNCPTSNSIIQTIPSATISGGRSTVSFLAVVQVYRDVRVRVTYSGVTPNCSSDGFAIRPSALTLITIPLMATPPSAVAPETIKAGTNFTLRATTSPAAGYAGALTLDNGKLAAQTSVQDLTIQSGGVVGGLAPASLTVNAAPTDNASYGEVGYLYLAPGAFRDDAFTVVDSAVGDCIAFDPLNPTNEDYLADTLVGGVKYGCSIGNKTTVSFGRFIPHHFDVTVTQGCSAGGFTYSGQPMVVQVTARNSGGGVTQNYSPVFSKIVTLSEVNGISGSLSHVSVGANAFSAGVASAVPTFTFTTKTTSPAIIRLRAIDTDGVSSETGAEGTATIRSGRARISNAYGSELLDLAMSFRTEYWNGVGWMLNNADVCTGDTALGAANAVSLTLSSGLTCVWDATPAPGLSNVGCATAAPAGRKYLEGATPSVGFAGNFNLWLKKPGSAGTVTVTPSVPAWLGPVPPARATFGIYKTPIIYMRENY